MSQDLCRCTANNLATQSVASRSPETTVTEAVDCLETNGFDVAPVINDDDAVRGYVTLERLQEAESGAQVNAIPLITESVNCSPKSPTA